jgi:multidrug efflux pump subunit AcrB
VYAPDFLVNMDRARALQFGITASDIGNNISTTFTSSETVQPNFWTDPKNGIPYYIAAQTPQYLVSSMGDMGNTPVNTGTAPQTTFQVRPGTQPVPGELQNVATFERDSVPGSASQANIQPVYEVYASTQGRDLGSIASSIDKVTTDLKKELKPGNTIQVTGQIDSMNQAFRDMGIGLVFAAVFVYLLMVVNYQTWGDPFVVILALPATFCGIVTMLYIIDTTLSVPSLMGAIMAVGVASANSILLVTFAREQRLAGSTAFDAAIAAGHTRIRPVLMTAAAMIVGMIPMAIGGPGEEQNAALARAVIGGLLVRDPNHPPRRALSLCDAAQGQRRQGRSRCLRRGSRMNEIEQTPLLKGPPPRPLLPAPDRDAAPPTPRRSRPHARAPAFGRGLHG